MQIYNYPNKKFHLKGKKTHTHTDKRKSEKQPWKEDTLQKE